MCQQVVLVFISAPSSLVASFYSWKTQFYTIYYFDLFSVRTIMEAITTAGSKRQRKEEGKLLKRQRIQEAGGLRPRNHPKTKPQRSSSELQQSNIQQDATIPFSLLPSQDRPESNVSQSQRPSNVNNGNKKNSNTNTNTYTTNHRFGRVMEQVPCPDRPRFATLSIAIPGSIVANCQTRELKTQIVGQIARAATLYHVDEIIVFDDQLSKQHQQQQNFKNRLNRSVRGGGGMQSSTSSRSKDNKSAANLEELKTNHTEDADTDGKSTTQNQEQQQQQQQQQVHNTSTRPTSDPHTFMARVLQYCECPQYLRRHFFPMHPDLQFAGLLSPIDAPHHVRAEDRCTFREGVVLSQKYTTLNNNTKNQTSGGSSGSLVNCGIRGRPVRIDVALQPDIRCTVQLDPTLYGKPGPLHGIVVSPQTPTHQDGTYWGYTVRVATSLTAVWEECPFNIGSCDNDDSTSNKNYYDLKIGTSERGHESVDDPNFTLLRQSFADDTKSATSTNNGHNSNISSYYKHALIVFGGVAGIEECVDADERMSLPGSLSYQLFDKWINICPHQGSRTIRSEEAVLIALAKLRPFLVEAAIPTKGYARGMKQSQSTSSKQNEEHSAATTAVTFPDAEPLSEESSCSDNDDDQ